jgi:TonB family protein
MLDVWALPRIDPTRIRRLLLGGCIGAVLIGTGAYGAATIVHSPAPPIKEKKKEKIIEVSLTPTVEEEPAGGSEASAPAAAPMPQVRQQKPVQQVQNVPKEAKSTDVYEGDKGPVNFGTGGSGNGTGTGSGNGSGNAPPKKVEPPPPPPEKPKAPKINPADYDPPKCKRRGIDSARAQAAGVEGKVIVSYTVTASGAVTNVKAESGPPELMPLAVAAVSGWTCEPARMKADGSAVQVTKKVPLTVKLK